MLRDRPAPGQRCATTPLSIARPGPVLRRRHLALFILTACGEDAPARPLDAAAISAARDLGDRPAFAAAGSVSGDYTAEDARVAPWADSRKAFGGSLADAGDYNGDGVTDIIVGDEPLTAAHLFFGPLFDGDYAASTADLTLVGVDLGDGAGFAV